MASPASRRDQEEEHPVSRSRSRSRDRDRAAASQGHPEGGRLQQAVSVRFTEDELRRIQAYSVIFGISPNAVIREACEYFLTHKVGTKEYDEALTAYRKRSEEQVAALEEMRNVS
jgi:hypothetical protein